MKLLDSRSPEILWRLVGLLGKWLIDLLCFSLRVEAVGFESVRRLMASRRFIFAFWHSRILLVSYLHQGWNGAILASASRDGEIIARVLARQGHETVRGSTGRGGLRALAKLIKCLKDQDRPGVMIPDGPQGPAFRVQPGVILLAQKTGHHIIPVSYSARKIKVVNSWDRFVLPCPLTRARMVYGAPVVVPRRADQAALETCRLRLEEELNRITFAHDRYFGHTHTGPIVEPPSGNF